MTVQDAELCLTVLSTSTKLRPLPAISTLVAKRASAEFGGAIAHDNWTEGPSYVDVQQLVAAKDFNPHAVVLTPADAGQAATWLESLRRDPRLALVPVFIDRSFGEAIDALSDGVASTPEAAAREAAPIAARAASLSRRETAEGDERLLAFLFLRRERVLTPIADWRDERIYRYPLADALTRPGEDGFLMLERLRRRGLLETAGLVDRVHTCPSCSAGQLLFIETCPQCGSIDTGEQNFLHCYACGHVGTQEEYLANEGLSCPKCAARLRHIGVDYDRALETCVCKACSGRFTDPNVQARCLQCRKSSATDELAERSYHGLRLSAAGELAARTGQVGDFFKLLDEFSQAHPEYFRRTLEWLLDLARRHKEVQFGLVCLKFANVHLLASKLPRHRVAQMFDALAQRLRALIRGTDLFMRDDDEYCWLLLPQTPPVGVAILLERIEALGPAAAPEEGLRIEIATASYTSADAEEGSTSNARMLMGTLRSRVS
jgi:GGDEF domain-containing protein